MAGLNLFTNNAATTLASSISNVDTSLTVATSTGNLFPTLTGSEYFFCTLANTAGTVEIIKVTARSGDTFSTIVRGQDGTSAVSWSAGDKVELRLTRIDLLNFPQLDSTNTFAAAQTFSSTGVFSIGTSQFYKDASGNVGIGTASPTQKLDITGNAAVSGQLMAGTTTTYSDGTIGTPRLQWRAAAGTYVGAVSIADTTSGLEHWVLRNPNGSIGSISTNGTSFVFNTAATERMRIDSSGNVGIGTTSPTQKLQVYSSGSNGGQIQITNASTGATSADGVLFGYDTSNDVIINNQEATLIKLYTSGTERMRIDSAGLLQFNSGYGSVATAYGCRAWVNFDGTAASNLTGTYTRTSPSTTLTVTATAHGLIVGNSVNLNFTTGTGLDGIYTVVTVADANTFTVTTVASTTTSGNVTLLRNTIRESGNVSSITDNGTGDFTVNFTTAMPDANYTAVFGTTAGSTSTNNYVQGIHVTGSSTTGAATTKTTSALRILGRSAAGSSADCEQNNVAIFR